jgi:hypothetical protein
MTVQAATRVPWPTVFVSVPVLSEVCCLPRIFARLARDLSGVSLDDGRSGAGAVDPRRLAARDVRE